MDSLLAGEAYDTSRPAALTRGRRARASHIGVARRCVNERTRYNAFVDNYESLLLTSLSRFRMIRERAVIVEAPCNQLCG